MAQRFRTDLVDEIVQGGIKFWRAVTATGSILLKDFKMERTNANTQEGSAFGAKEANAIHAFLNGLLEGTETVNKATNSTNASNAPDGLVIGSKDNPRDMTIWFSVNRYAQIYGTETDGFRIRLRDGTGNPLGVILSSDASGKGYVFQSENATKLGNQIPDYYAKQINTDYYQRLSLGSIKSGWSVKSGEGYKNVALNPLMYPNGEPEFSGIYLSGNGYARASIDGYYEIIVDRIQTSVPVSLAVNKMAINLDSTNVFGHAFAKLNKDDYLEVSLATSSTTPVTITYSNIYFRRIC